MPFFEYKAFNNKNNQTVKAVIEATNEDEASRLVIDQGLTLIEIKSRKAGGKSDLSILSFLNKVTTKDLVVFARQFAVMLKASVPIVKSLRILIKQTKNQKLQTILNEVADEVDGGMKLSEVLAKYPKVFSNFFVSMIKSGETSGRLDEVLEYLANQQEKDYDLMSKIKGAMIYPIFIICSLVVVGIIMMVVVVPKLTDILTESGGELPMATRILIGTSSFLSDFWWILIILLVAIVFAIRYSLNTKKGKRQWDWLAIKMPIFGKLFQKIYLVRFARSLSTLTSGGLPLVEALQITSDVVGNQVYKNIIEKTIKEVEEGNQIATVLIESKDVPAMVSYMVGVGEQTGKLDVVLDKLGDFYSREIDNLVTNLVGLIEPLIMVVLGVAVGLMVSAIILPMYNLASAF